MANTIRSPLRKPIPNPEWLNFLQLQILFFGSSKQDWVLNNSSESCLSFFARPETTRKSKASTFCSLPSVFFNGQKTLDPRSIVPLLFCSCPSCWNDKRGMIRSFCGHEKKIWLQMSHLAKDC